MRMTRDLAWEHYTRTKQIGETDLSSKFFLSRILFARFGLYGLTDERIIIPNGFAEYRLPDVFVKARVPQLAFELDGYIHGDGDEITKRHSDEERDYDYSLVIGLNEIIINRSLTLNYQEEKIVKIIEDAGVKQLEGTYRPNHC